MVDLVTVTETQGFAMATILARRGVTGAMIGDALSVDMPRGPTWVAGGSVVIIGSGPGAWLVQNTAEAPAWIDGLRTRMAGLASVSDQSGAYRVFRLEGRFARQLLQRGVAVDLDAVAFPVGSVAITAIAYLDVIVRRLDGADVFELAVFRSSSQAFVRWLDAAVAGL